MSVVVVDGGSVILNFPRTADACETTDFHGTLSIMHEPEYRANNVQVHTMLKQSIRICIRCELDYKINLTTDSLENLCRFVEFRIMSKYVSFIH